MRFRGVSAMGRRHAVSCWTGAALLLVSAPVSAGTTGQLWGNIADGNGNPLAGVSVEVSSPAQIGLPKGTVTDDQGRFYFARLAPGLFIVRLSRDGYLDQELTDVRVRLDRVTEIGATMSPSTFSGEIVVAQTSPVIDPVQVSTGQTYSSDYITNTSSTWVDLTKQTAGTSPYNFRRTLASALQDNAYVLDGFDATNWYDRWPNLAAAALPFDAVQEVTIHTAGFEAEFGQAIGAVTNVTTKSGGNVFSGTLDVRYADSGLVENGDHYNPDDQESRFRRLAATLGGPIVRDLLWFFGAVGFTREERTPAGAPTTYDSNSQTFTGKLTWLPSASWSLVGLYTYAPSTIDHIDSSQFRAADATSNWENQPVIASLEVAGVLSSNSLWSLRLGHKKWDHIELPTDNDLVTIGHFNLATEEHYGNRANQWYGESTQDGISSDLTWFSRGTLGSHEFKGGLGYGEPKFTDEWCRNGGGRCTAGEEGFLFRDTILEPFGIFPYELVVTAAEGPLDYQATYYTAYLQDTWRTLPELTVKLGLRWDRVDYRNNTGKIADLSEPQPRVGAAWDIGGSGKTILKTSWGRFMHPGVGILAGNASETQFPRESWASCSLAGVVRGFDPSMCAALAAAQGWWWRSDPEGWDPAGWFLVPSLPGSVVFAEPHRVADDLRAGYSDQWILGFEQELYRSTSLELSFVHKESSNLFDDTCNGNLPEPTAGSECSYLVVANLPQIKNTYQAWMVRFETNTVQWAHVLASWVISSSRGSMDVNTSESVDFDIYPYHFVNRYGYLADQVHHRFKLDGYLLLPHGFSVALNGWWDSDWRWTPYEILKPPLWGSVFLEPRGNRRAGRYHQLDLQLGKSFQIGPTNFEMLAAVYNALDSECIWDVCRNVSGCGGEYEVGDAIQWQQPRSYQLGFRVDF